MKEKSPRLFACCLLGFFFSVTPAVHGATLTDAIAILKLLTTPTPSSSPAAPVLDWDRDQRVTITDLQLILHQLGNMEQSPPAGDYTLLAWNDLGMHCVDGNDYSVFSILPPYNNLHAQLVKKDGGLVSGAVRLTFNAMPNRNGAWNTYSAAKTNFWTYAEPLYGFLYGGGPLPLEQGLTGLTTPGHLPQDLAYTANWNWWAAEALPILPYNDDGSKSYYQLVQVRALDQNNHLLAAATAVLPVSDEMDCRKCHGSTSGYPAARPADGWVGAADPERDYKFNILRLHDQLQGTSLFIQASQGIPVLCADCHLSNALPGSGKAGISALTAAIHSRHAEVLDPITGQPLDAATNRQACYSCHPGQQTKCLRGAMGGIGGINCQACHGSMAMTGNAARTGWLDEPTCQQCHQNGQRYSSVFLATGIPRPATDLRFATNQDTPITGKSLYRFSAGHHGIQCEGCHGATHAVYPSIDEEDNIQAVEIQGHAGTISQCTACHTVSPKTVDGGPHGLHTIGQYWVNAHGEYAEHGNITTCAYCHGADFRGAPLAAAFTARSFNTKWGVKRFAAHQQIGCYDCHNGPYED